MALADLHSAAASADLARLRQHWWLNKHRINGYNRDKQTPLHLACINGHADVVQFLVEKKCKLNPGDKLNKSPLIKAVEHQHRDCAAILLEHGASLNHRSVNGNTALHFAVMVSSKPLVELLLEHGADIDAENKLGHTPLTLAIIGNCEEVIKFLLEKGADVNAQDNVYRTPLKAAILSGNMKAIQLLLHHGAVFPQSYGGLYACQTSMNMVQNDVIADEQIGSSCYETTPVIPMETSALAESCDVPKEEAGEKKHNGPAADQNKVSVHSITVQLNRGAWQAARAAKEEDNGSLCNPKRLSDLLEKVINPVQRPAGKRRGVGMRCFAEELGKGVLQAGGGAVKKEDTDSSWDSEITETDPKSQGRMWASVWLPSANSNRLDARSAAVECGKGVLPAAAAGEAKKEDGDSSWDSEPFSEIVEEVFGGKQCRAAGHKGVGALSAAVERSKAGGAGEDDDSSWDSETESEGEWKVLAAVQLPAANSNRLDACSAAVERIKGILKQAWREVKKEDRVLQPAWREAKQEDDFPWDSEVPSLRKTGPPSDSLASGTDSEGQRTVSANVQFPSADQKRVGVSSAAMERGKAARAEQKEHFISSSENELPTLQGEDFQLKVDSSTQTDPEQDEQPLARQKLDKILKKNSLEGASLGTVKTNSKKEQKLLLEKLESCKTRLKDLKESLNKNDYYAESGKNALKEKKVIKILRSMQDRLAESLDSSAAAILQLEEHFQWLEVKMARLEDTIQQQAKTIEAFETIQ